MHPGRHGASHDPPGVTVSEITDLELASVIARNGAAATLSERERDLDGIDLPDRPALRRGRAGAFIGVGPGRWLALRDAGDPPLARMLAHDFDGLAAVADQSDAYAVCRLAGRHARDALAKGATIDLHPRAFPPGSAAVTSVAGIGVVMWLVDQAPSFEVAVARSLASSFWYWLIASAGEYGLEVRGAEVAKVAGTAGA